MKKNVEKRVLFKESLRNIKERMLQAYVETKNRAYDNRQKEMFVRRCLDKSNSMAKSICKNVKCDKEKRIQTVGFDLYDLSMFFGYERALKYGERQMWEILYYTSMGIMDDGATIPKKDIKEHILDMVLYEDSKDFADMLYAMHFMATDREIRKTFAVSYLDGGATAELALSIATVKDRKIRKKLVYKMYSLKKTGKLGPVERERLCQKIKIAVDNSYEKEPLSPLGDDIYEIVRSIRKLEKGRPA